MEKIAHSLLLFTFLFMMFQWVFKFPQEETAGEVGAYLVLVAIALYIAKLIYLLITKLEVKD